MTLQSSTNTLLSSQTTTARPTRTTPAGRPAPTGSKGITYTNPATNANPTQPTPQKPLKNKPTTGVSQTPKNHHTDSNKPPVTRQNTQQKNVSPGVSRPPTRDSIWPAEPSSKISLPYPVPAMLADMIRRYADNGYYVRAKNQGPCAFAPFTDHSMCEARSRRA